MHRHPGDLHGALEHRIDETGDAVVVREAPLVGIGRGREEAPGLEQEPVEQLGLPHVGVEQREPAEARPDADDRIPEMLAYAGFTYVAFGENYCSGVPFSETVDSIMFGEPRATAQIFEQAIVHFDAALGHPAVSEEIENLARVGKGRALLSLDRTGEAPSRTLPSLRVRSWYHSQPPNESHPSSSSVGSGPQSGKGSAGGGPPRKRNSSV